MRPQGPTFFPLGGSAKEWLTAEVQNLSVGDTTGLMLAERGEGPDALISPDGSLGRVVLPMGMAADDEGVVFLMGQNQPGVRGFDPETCAFLPLAGVGDEFGSEVGQFYKQFGDPANRLPSNIAVTRGNLYVADRGNRRVQVFALATRSIKYVWGPRDGESRRIKKENERAWEPVDVAAQAGRAYILDRRYSRVYVHRSGRDRLKLLIQGPATDRDWTRIAIDKTGRVYLLNIADRRPQVEIYDNEGRYLETKYTAGDIRDRFDPPTIQLRPLDQKEDHFYFPLPEKLKLLCRKCAAERKRLTFQQPCDDRSFKPPENEPCSDSNLRELFFDREGARLRRSPKPTIGPKVFVEKGVWRSEALDSQTYRCQWHRIELNLYQLPAGTRVKVRTYTDEGKLSDEDAKQRMATFGKVAHSVAGQLARPPQANGKQGGNEDRGQKCSHQSNDSEEQGSGGTCAAGNSKNSHEFLIQSREGQYLWIEISLEGDGYDTPAIRSARIHYPRSSYLEYLPAVYSADDESRSFLERFLSIFQTEWDALEECIQDVAGLFDPKAVPAGKALEYLASWFALPLEGRWNGEKKRALLAAITKIYFGSWKVTGDRTVCMTEVNTATAARRGTREGLRRYLQVYLQNITEIGAEDQGDFPLIDEGFRERQRLMLSLGDTSALSHGAPLWSPSVVGRLHFGEFAREGEARLVSTGDPQHEIFKEFAHRFRIFMPSSWIKTATDEEMVHRAVREEKPAHTSYELCLIEPRFRVGLQSTVGIDTVIGAWPTARLACTHDTNIPPSRLPRHCLGLDTILAAVPGVHPTMQVGSKTRAGIDTLLN